MPNRLKIRLEYIEKNDNIALNCNYMQDYNKKSARGASSFKNTA